MIPRVIITWQDWRTLLSSTVVQNWFLKKDSRKQASYLQLGDLRCNIRTQIDALKICTWLLKYRKEMKSDLQPKDYFQQKNRKMAKTEAALQRCSENMQQTYRRILMLRCDINKVAKCAFIFMGVLLLHIFRTSFPKNTSEGLLLQTLAKTRQYENLLQKCVWLIYNRMRNFITTNAGQN